MEVETAESNGNIFQWLNLHRGQNVLVVADGAAFGSEIDRIIKLQQSGTVDFRIVLPESFEWLILKSGLIKTDDVSAILEQPSSFVESREFFSWERFFTDYLISNTVNTPFAYSKNRINPVYLIRTNADKIVKEIQPA